jgi:hypothetical protein
METFRANRVEQKTQVVLTENFQPHLIFGSETKNPPEWRSILCIFHLSLGFWPYSQKIKLGWKVLQETSRPCTNLFGSAYNLYFKILFTF